MVTHRSPPLCSGICASFPVHGDVILAWLFVFILPFVKDTPYQFGHRYAERGCSTFQCDVQWLW